MNLYIRYFDEECVVSSAEEAFDFLSSLPGITLDAVSYTHLTLPTNYRV